ncbi:hypothetical protein [Desertibacillus haloalkaliphilus]|uniref:hypothetical protein n=1 Tax=Desertibacillus haloalkaliphilus TaxID=1328930 RepID=UPI001C2574B2|nr:hypothetical protein [Desertibacillus haloalkaliphilus]MBU8906189.1 hypothetical protein [Desertibacillus haloalkaliphilus]
MRKAMFISLLAVFLNVCVMVIAAEETVNEDISKIMNGLIPANAFLVSPDQPASTGPIQLIDFDDDEEKEVIINYKLEAEQQPSPSQYGAIIVKQVKGEWKKVWETSSQGVGLDYSGVADITGDGTKEYLFGVTIGASAGNILEVFKWESASLNKLTKVSYHMMELLRNQEDVGLAVWRRYIADTYFVDVLTWDGQQLVHDDELYDQYYPEIEKYHNDQIT